MELKTWRVYTVVEWQRMLFRTKLFMGTNLFEIWRPSVHHKICLLTRAFGLIWGFVFFIIQYWYYVPCFCNCVLCDISSVFVFVIEIGNQIRHVVGRYWLPDFKRLHHGGRSELAVTTLMVNVQLARSHVRGHISWGWALPWGPLQTQQLWPFCLWSAFVLWLYKHFI